MLVSFSAGLFGREAAQSYAFIGVYNEHLEHFLSPLTWDQPSVRLRVKRRNLNLGPDWRSVYPEPDNDSPVRVELRFCWPRLSHMGYPEFPLIHCWT